MRSNLVVLAVMLAAFSLLVGCVGASPSPSGSPSPSASPSPSGSPSPSASPSASASTNPAPVPSSGSLVVSSHAQAAALVLASDARFRGIGPQLFDVIGQCCWYEVLETGDGWQVNVTIGSGDCMAGCIERQTWQYSVDRAGSIELVSEEGTAEVPPGGGGSGPATVVIQAVAGPTCPAETIPPDPSCMPRPVVGAEIVVRGPDGHEFARGVTDAEGRMTLTAPAGTYWLDPQPVEGLMGTAAGIAFRVGDGDEAAYSVYYDTGIR